MSNEADPLYVRAREPMPHTDRGKLGARARWGPPRVVRLDQIDGDTARLIRALLAQKEAVPSVSETSPGTAQEVRRASDEPS